MACLWRARSLRSVPDLAVQVQLALRAKGLRDDITVIVVDALPSDDLRTPPSLARKHSHTACVARCAFSSSLIRM